MMAVDMFLKLDGIEGESRDAKHKNEIDVESFSWGATAPVGTAPGGTGGATGKVSVQDFSFTAPVSKASPKLFLACAQRQNIKTALLSLRRSGGQQADFLKITLSGVTVTGYTQTAHNEADGGNPGDVVTLNFGKIQVSYSAQRADGTLDAPVTVDWDLKKNTKT